MKKLLLLVLCMAIMSSAFACVKICNHQSYSNGVCVECGKVCEHTFEDGACTVCNAACEHVYEDSVCTVCNAACGHDYEDGVCTECGKVCGHDYADGVCVECGADDPDFVPADGGVSLYAEIVDDFKALILYKFTYEELPARSEDDPYYTDALYSAATYYDPSVEMGYAFKDINGDGWTELMIIGREKRMYALFTIVNKAPAVVETFGNGKGYLAPDGMVFYNVSEENTTTIENHMKYLVDGQLVGAEYGRVDVDANKDTDDETYYITENGVKTDLTYDEYKVYRDNVYVYYWDYSTRLCQRAGLKFLPALTELDESVGTADFSSYAKITETFSKMYTDVANNKFSRTDWTSGKYDIKMKFKSDEDYFVYNKILDAVTTVISPGSTTKYGVAEKDLNGDNVNELIITDTKCNVYAIFTMVDGKPVLVDSFNDVRYASIGADGKVYVAERILPV